MRRLILLLGVLPGAALAQDGTAYSVYSDLAGRGEQISPYSVDADGTVLESGPTLNGQAILGGSARYSTGIFKAAAFGEVGLHSGALTGQPEIDGIDLPQTAPSDIVVRRANARLSAGSYVTVGGGLMSSDWGLGLLANSGRRAWEPGSARFSDPREGDVVLRGLIVTGPHTGKGVVLAGFVDRVYDDDLLILDDTAWQAGGSLSVGPPQQRDKPWGGVYGLHREQTATDGDVTTLSGADLAFRLPFALSETMQLTVEGEGAFITGETELGPSVEHPTHDVFQLGGALRASLDAGRMGGVFDLLYASGDQNIDDSSLNGFRVDPNYEFGLIAFRHVLSAHTGRAPITAGDPDLVGIPSEDLDRIPTRGSVTNTVALFPRMWGRPYKELEVYGGPLLIWNEVPLVDARNTRLAGGVPTNALNGGEGLYMGTELDLGVRMPIDIAGSRLIAGAEGAVFLPGSGLTGGDVAPETVYGGRLMVRYLFGYTGPDGGIRGDL